MDLTLAPLTAIDAIRAALTHLSDAELTALRAVADTPEASGEQHNMDKDRFAVHSEPPFLRL